MGGHNIIYRVDVDNWHSGNIVDNRELIKEMKTLKRVEKKKR